MLRIGVDVGGTNTDAALLDGDTVVATVKRSTASNIVDGVIEAIRAVIADAGCTPADVSTLMIGTTQFLNALIERRGLEKTAVLRLCGPTTRSLPPMVDWPEDLKDAVAAGYLLADGGVEYDGTPLTPLDPQAIRTQAKAWQAAGVRAVAVSAVFALVKSDMELEAEAILREEMPQANISLSHRIGHNGLLPRESATILNACLSTLGKATITAFRDAAAALDLNCPLFLTQNDGTLMTADYAERFPIFTIASGPTNSMRGAAFLTGLKDAVVIDIGGTTTDIGVLSAGFPRARGEGALIAGVRTNFRVPDVLSLGLGGGSIVSTQGEMEVGPQSVGYQIREKALCFGGGTLTATDIAVASEWVDLGDPSRVAHLDSDRVAQAAAIMKRSIEDIADQMKPSAAPIPAVLVGGGSILVADGLEGTSEVLRPDHFGSANAIGAAISQVSGEIELVINLDEHPREEAVAATIDAARARAVDAGACPTTLEVVELAEVPMAYMPGNAIQLAVKVIGDVKL